MSPLETSPTDDAAPGTVSGRAPTQAAPFAAGTGFEHGEVCCEIASILRNVAKPNRWGRVVCNNAAVLIERNPDVLRRPDVAFYSADALPFDELIEGPPEVPPDVVFEVRSPGDRSRDVLMAAAEYLASGVGMVVIVDPQSRTANVFVDAQPIRVMGEDDVVPLPAPLDKLRRTVGEWLG
jgi:Uma2 family endonuclease